LVNVDIRSISDGSGHLAERDQIERVFRRLPIDQRVVLVLHHHLDMSQTEIAALLGIPLGTAKSRLRYGSSAFRAALAAEERTAQDTERIA
jgi:RNA polymerase sigma-70 factor (ECF subfamily)